MSRKKNRNGILPYYRMRHGNYYDLPTSLDDHELFQGEQHDFFNGQKSDPGAFYPG